MAGPLSGLRVIEFAGIGPGPFCGMLLADLGAEVIRIDRPGARGAPTDTLNRSKRSIVLDLKQSAAVDAAIQLAETADAVFEGLRPGVMERLGLGPDVLLQRNERLVYGRVTGWGQDGPLSQAAGHDPNYIAITGALHAIGPADGPPILPLNLLGDFAGGGQLLAFGLVSAMLEAQRSGRGQVVDAAMIDGVSSLMAPIYSMFATGRYRDQRGANFLDGGAHFNNAYETSDGLYISICSLEPQFHALLLDKLELDPDEFSDPMNSERWSERRERLAALFKQRTRDQWCELLEGTDVCFAPILSLSEAPLHPHNQHRKTFIERDGQIEPAPSPRFSRTQPDPPRTPPAAGADTDELLLGVGMTESRVEELRRTGACA